MTRNDQRLAGLTLRSASPPTRRPRPGPRLISEQVAAALRDLQLLDPDCERLVFSVRVHDRRLILSADEDELEELIGFVAAEANHEANRRRQQRLDVAFDALNDAAARLGG